MKKHRILGLTGLAAIAGIIAVGLLLQDQTKPKLNDSVALAEPGNFTEQTGLSPLAAKSGNTELPPLPPELQGLEPTTPLTTDAEGNLIPSHDLRVMFDFYLANIDQEPLATVLARIRAALSMSLKEPALGQALSLLERYVGYRMSLEELQKELPGAVADNGFDLEALQQRQKKMQSLQHAHFDREEKAAFFDDDKQLDDYILAKLKIEQTSALTTDQKRQRLDQLEQQLPEPVQVARKRAVIHGDVYQQAEALKASNASEAELYQLRAQELGEDAALSLAQLDRQQKEWQQRLADYQKEKSRVVQAGLSQADQAIAIDRLREQLFSATERLRVRALDGDWH